MLHSKVRACLLSSGTPRWPSGLLLQELPCGHTSALRGSRAPVVPRPLRCCPGVFVLPALQTVAVWAEAQEAEEAPLGEEPWLSPQLQDIPVALGILTLFSFSKAPAPPCWPQDPALRCWDTSQLHMLTVLVEDTAAGSSAQGLSPNASPVTFAGPLTILHLVCLHVNRQ